MSNAVSPIDETRRRGFERQWIELGAARIEDHLPDDADPCFAPTLMELVCIDMEMRHRLGKPAEVADYVRRFSLGETERARLAEESAYLARRQVARGSRIGRYVLKDVLGQGAFAVVWRAHDPDLSRVVALKRLRPALGADEEARERFRREAKSAAQLRHPAIVTVHEVGDDVSGPFLVADYIPGPTLAEALKQRPFLPEEAAEIVARLADALDYAHQFGVVHRDVKPSNILLDEAGRALITDFGLARLSQNDATLTRHGQLLGTPAYMSPEQAQGDHDAIDHRSDVYSLGVVLYELVCGRPPFQGDSATLFYAVVHKEVPRPRRIRHDIPIDLETICLKAMAREPDRRYVTAGELADDLRRFLSREPVAARRNGLFGRAALWARRNPAIAVSLAAIVVVVAIAFHQVLNGRTRVEVAHRTSQANLYRSLVRQAEAQLALPRGAGREAAWASIQDAVDVETEARDTYELRNLGLRYLTAQGPHFKQLGAWSAPEAVTALALSSDGERVVEAGSAGTRLRDAATGEILAADRTPARIVAFDSIGAQIAVAHGRTVRLLDGRTLQAQGSLVCEEPPEALAYARSPRARLASASETGPVEVFDLAPATPQRTHTFPDRAHSLTFGGNDRLVIGGVDGTLRQVDLATRETSWTSAFREPVRALAHQGQRITAVVWEQFTFTVVDLMSGGRRAPQGIHDAAVRAVCFGPQAHILTASDDGTLAAWDAELARVAEIRTGGDIQTAAAVGGHVIVVDRKGRRSLWTMRFAAERRSFHAQHRARFVPGTHVLFRGVSAFDAETARPVPSNLPPFGGMIWGVTVDDQGRRAASTSHEGVIELLDAGTFTREHQLQAAGAVSWTAAFSPDGRVLAAGTGNDITLWDTESGQVVRRLRGHDELVVALALRDDRIVSASLDGTVRVWRGETGDQAARLLSDVTVHDLAYLGDSLLAACHDGCLRVWQDDAGPPVTIEVSADPVWAVAAGPDGLVATGSQSGRVRLWDARTWTPLAELRAGPRVRSVDFDESGRFLAASVYVSRGAVWDLEALRQKLDRLGLDWK